MSRAPRCAHTVDRPTRSKVDREVKPWWMTVGIFAEGLRLHACMVTGKLVLLNIGWIDANMWSVTGENQKKPFTS